MKYDEIISLKMTKKDKQLLTEKAKFERLPLSSYVRNLIFENLEI